MVIEKLASRNEYKPFLRQSRPHAGKRTGPRGSNYTQRDREVGSCIKIGGASTSYGNLKPPHRGNPTDWWHYPAFHVLPASKQGTQGHTCASINVVPSVVGESLMHDARISPGLISKTGGYAARGSRSQLPKGGLSFPFSVTSNVPSSLRPRAVL